MSEYNTGDYEVYQPRGYTNDVYILNNGSQHIYFNEENVLQMIEALLKEFDLPYSKDCQSAKEAVRRFGPSPE